MTGEAGIGGERAPVIRPRIYVASLSDYNAGRLHGAWLDANVSVDALQDGVSAMLAGSPEPGAEEYAVHDYDDFGPLRLSEYESLETIAAVAAGIAEHGPAFAAWASRLDSLTLTELEGFEEAYEGDYESRTAYADGILDEWGVDLANMSNLPEIWQQYVRVDMDAWLHDCEVGGDLDIVDHPGGIWVFRS